MHTDILVQERLRFYQVEDFCEEAVEELKKMCSIREQEIKELIRTAKLELAKMIIMDMKKFKSAEKEELEEKENNIDQLEQELEDIVRFRTRLE